MTLIDIIFWAVNMVMMVGGIFMLVRILNHASKYNWNYGDNDIRDPLTIKMLKLLVASLALGLLAAVFNLGFAFLG